MEVISKTSGELVLRHIPWMPLVFGLVFLLLGIVFAIQVILGPSADYFGVIMTLGLPVALLTYLCNITTTTFSKSKNKVSIKHWRLIGSEPTTELQLSAINDIHISDPKGRSSGGTPIAAQITLEANGESYGLSKERSQFFRSKNNQEIVTKIRDFIGKSA